MRGDTIYLRDKLFQAAVLRALSNRPVQEHDTVLPGVSEYPLTYTHLQAHGFIYLQRLPSWQFQVIMSPVILDIYLTAHAGEAPLTHISDLPICHDVVVDSMQVFSLKIAKQD